MSLTRSSQCRQVPNKSRGGARHAAKWGQGRTTQNQKLPTRHQLPLSGTSLQNATRACGGSRGVNKTARWVQTTPTVMCRTRGPGGALVSLLAQRRQQHEAAPMRAERNQRSPGRAAGAGPPKTNIGGPGGPPKPTAGAQEGTPNPPEGGPSGAPKTHQGGPRGPKQAGTTPERRTRNVSPCGASKGKRRQHKAPTIAAD